MRNAQSRREQALRGVEAAFNSAILAMHRAAQGEISWQEVGQRIVRAMGTRTILFYILGATGEVEVLSNPGFEALDMRAYEMHYVADDLWAREIHRFPENTVRIMQELVSPETWEMAPINNEWVRPNGIDCFWGLGTKYRIDDRSNLILGIHRPHGEAEMGPGDVNNLTRVMEHLRLAVRTAGMLRSGQSKPDISTAILDVLDLGMVVIDRRGRIESMNPIAEDMLQNQDGLRIAAGGYLTTQLLEDEARLRSLIDEVTGAAAVTVAKSEAKTLVQRKSSQIPLRVSGAPLPRTDSARATGEARALIIIDDPIRQLAGAAPALQKHFRLTPAEARLAAQVASGMSVVEAARRQGVSHNTTRAQMRAVFEKMGIHRQSELAAIVNGIRGIG
jgi:DNA-binding CsgD family transcriptional regulator